MGFFGLVHNQFSIDTNFILLLLKISLHLIQGLYAQAELEFVLGGNCFKMLLFHEIEYLLAVSYIFLIKFCIMKGAFFRKIRKVRGKQNEERKNGKVTETEKRTE